MRGGGSELKKDTSPPLNSVPLVSGACQSPHTVSVLCQSNPQSVVQEKQLLPPQLAVLVGRNSSLLCVDRAPPVGGGGPSSSTALNCRAAIPTPVACAAPNVHVSAPPLLPEC